MEDLEFSVPPPKWTKGSVSMLIKLYKKWDLLYDHRNHLYFNKLVRANVLESITKSLQKYVPQMTQHEVKLKIHTLRSQYNKEYMKVLEAEKKGEYYEPKAYWYNELHFLKGFFNIKRRKPRETENNDYSTNFSDTEDQVISKRRKVKNDEQTYISDGNSQSETEEQLVTPEQNKTAGIISSSHTVDPLFELNQDIAYDESSISEANKPSSSKKVNPEQNVSDENDDENDVIKVNKNVTLKLSLAEKPTTLEEEYENTLTNFFRANIRSIKDKALQDELASKIMILIFEYKRKQRELDSL